MPRSQPSRSSTKGEKSSNTTASWRVPRHHDFRRARLTPGGNAGSASSRRGFVDPGAEPLGEVCRNKVLHSSEVETANPFVVQ
jgi:hypothetical protein